MNMQLGSHSTKTYMVNKHNIASINLTTCSTNKLGYFAVQRSFRSKSVSKAGNPSTKAIPDALHLELESSKTNVSIAEGEKLTLGLTYESDKKGRALSANQLSTVKPAGLSRTPLSGGVKTATTSLGLPPPPVAVRNLVELARFGHLCTMMSQMHHRRAGYPFGTVVDFAIDGAGYPIFTLSPLAIHARNLIEDPKCSLVVQMPGWTNLANARVTIFGECKKVPQNEQEVAREIFASKQSAGPARKERWVTGNFVYFRMTHIVDIYFVGGFGTVQWLNPADYLASVPDNVVLDNSAGTLQALNSTFSPRLCALLRVAGRPAVEATFISVDATGADVRVKSEAGEFLVERVGFSRSVENTADAIAGVEEALGTLASGADLEVPAPL